MLEHYALLYPVEPAELDAFMARVRLHGRGPSLALGDAERLEVHGGGILRLLFEHWRPGGRPAGLDDRYRFAADRRSVPLRDLYEAARAQLVLLPAGLPRLHVPLERPGEPAVHVDLDAYNLLALLIRLEPDPARAWRTRTGRALHLTQLMRRVRAEYLGTRPNGNAPEDHSSLHLVGLLVAFEARGGREGLAAVQRHFLDVELAQRGFDPSHASALLGHHTESLGHLLEAPGLAWSDTDKRRVKGWLAELEQERFRDFEDEPVDGLFHLVWGLRAVRAHRAALE